MKHDQYVAICPDCGATRPLDRTEVERGRHPICDECGQTMTVRAPIPDRAA